eukprot:12184980-Prorocentrum_lima.AAC.1
MTSSLVGSEMCIRDSAKCSHWGEGWILGEEWGCAKCGGCGEWCIIRRTNCLLYTSDAADDM